MELHLKNKKGIMCHHSNPRECLDDTISATRTEKARKPHIPSGSAARWHNKYGREYIPSQKAIHDLMRKHKNLAKRATDGEIKVIRAIRRRAYRSMPYVVHYQMMDCRHQTVGGFIEQLHARTCHYEEMARRGEVRSSVIGVDANRYLGRPVDMRHDRMYQVEIAGADHFPRPLKCKVDEKSLRQMGGIWRDDDWKDQDEREDDMIEACVQDVWAKLQKTPTAIPIAGPSRAGLPRFGPPADPDAGAEVIDIFDDDDDADQNGFTDMQDITQVSDEPTNPTGALLAPFVFDEASIFVGQQFSEVIPEQGDAGILPSEEQFLQAIDDWVNTTALAQPVFAAVTTQPLSDESLQPIGTGFFPTEEQFQQDFVDELFGTTSLPKFSDAHLQLRNTGFFSTAEQFQPEVIDFRAVDVSTLTTQQFSDELPELEDFDSDDWVSFDALN